MEPSTLTSTSPTSAPAPVTPVTPVTSSLRPSPADPTIGPAVARVVRRHHFAVLATASATGRPHAAGVMYQVAGGQAWVSTLRSSRKARNAAARGQVALTLAVRRIPMFPPATVQLRGRATVVDLDDPELRRLAEAGSLPAVTGRGELELPDGCFLRIDLAERVPVYALGMSCWQLLRHPLDAARVALVDWEA